METELAVFLMFFRRCHMDLRMLDVVAIHFEPRLQSLLSLSGDDSPLGSPPSSNGVAERTFARQLLASASPSRRGALLYQHGPLVYPQNNTQSYAYVTDTFATGAVETRLAMVIMANSHGVMHDAATACIHPNA